MLVAVLDDGVNTGFFENIGKLAFNLRVDEKNRIVNRCGYNHYEVSHGTICASIIRKYAPDAKIGSIKIISDETMRGNPIQLIKALNWCYEHDIKLIHMSVGSQVIKDTPLIAELVQRLVDKGCILVSALTNTMKYSAPACLENVLGVRTSGILKDDQFLFDNGGLFSTPFVASSLHELTDYTSKTRITPLCNSYAAPLITANVCKLLKENYTLTVSETRALLGGNKKLCSFNELLKKTPMLTNKVDIPIILINGDVLSSVKAATMMNKMFLQRGYSCMAFSDNKQTCAYGITKIPKRIKTLNLFSYYERCLNLDLILLISNRYAKADATLQLSQEVTRGKYIGDHATIPEEFTYHQIRHAVDYFQKHGD